MRLLILLAIALLFCQPVAPAYAERTQLTIETRDGPRTALVYHAGSAPKPAVIVLHGGMGSGAQMVRWSGFAAAAGKRGLLAVFPDGLRRQWNDGRADFVGSTADDVGYLTALIDQLVAQRLADRRRIYITGASNGGMMSLRLACEAGERIAGLAPLIATMPATLSGCRPTRPMPILVMNGDADPMVPYGGGEVGLSGGRGRVLSTDETIAPFAGRNGCADVKERKLPDRDPADGSSVTLLTWTGCDTPTILYRIEGGGHQLPGAQPLPQLMMGKHNRDIDAAAIVMDFFADLAKRN